VKPTPARTLVAHLVDWSVTAAGFRAEDPVAIVRNNRVEACSAAARGAGVRNGIRRREAQNRLPELHVIDADDTRDALAFEPVVAAIEETTTNVDIFRPGICMLSTRGPSRYFGGDTALMVKILESVESVMQELGAICQIGIADSPFAARLAAQHSTIVPVGETPQFLAPLSVEALERPELASLLTRLGVRTLGQFAALDRDDVTARFGLDGAKAHRLARGEDSYQLTPRPADENLTVQAELDPPAERIDAAAFAGRALAVQLLRDLDASGLSCSRVVVEAETENQETLRRSWRFDGVCTEKSLSERVRWQLDGWLSGAVSAERPTGGVSVLRLIPDDLHPNDGEQYDLWNTKSVDDDRAAAGFARVQGMLGPQSVVRAATRGGRHPAERVDLTPWGETPELEPNNATLPWPNALPSPSPTIVHAHERPIDVLDVRGERVSVSRRGMLSQQPVLLRASGADERIVAWAGPWTSDDQWWDAERRKKRAFLQVVTESGAAHLIAVSEGQWNLDGSYD
jgi:protein ImuB